MFYHSQVFKKKITTQSRQTTHQPPIYKETIKWGQALPLKNWKSVVSCLTLQELTFLVTQLVGLLLRAPWSKYKRFIWGHENECFLKYEKYFLHPYPLNSPPPPIYCPPPNFGIYLMLPPTSNYFNNTKFNNFVWVANPLLVRHHLK